MLSELLAYSGSVIISLNAYVGGTMPSEHACLGCLGKQTGQMTSESIGYTLGPFIPTI